ncbi:guanylate cyclase 2G-like protein [Labeo rohita]|uniref:Guanylate cyclase 2G-like protein n=1 Tax=Labeo rohita TaxID=84645 RepID=A0A498NC07_LABRO|nr:guanylate cyclase 2G-like protein [Labeo rohita]
MSTQFLHAHHSKEPPVSFTKTSLRPSDDARDLVSFGAAEDDLDDDDDAMSTAASGSGDWSACLESEASHSELREPPAPIDEELVKILSEAVQDLGLDWSPPEQPTKNRLDMRYLQSGRQVAAPQRPAPFFPEVHEEISRSWRSPYSARAQAAGSRMLSSVDGADRWGYTKPPPVEEAVAAHLCPSAQRSVRCTPTAFQILFFPAFKKARKTAAYSFRGSEGGPGASREAKSKAVPLPKEDGTTPFQCGTRSTAAFLTAVV